METLKILVVSQKGGVGKSTLSTNFAAWCGEIKKQSTVLLDFDPHASSSTWLKELNPKNVSFKEASSSDFSAQRWFMGARTIVRKANETCEVAIADVTWTKGMNSDFLTEFDLVIVPTSVSQLDIDATHDFISQNLTSFQETTKNLSKKNLPPALMLLPSMVTEEQLKTNPFTNKNFDFPFLLLPPIPFDLNVRLLFKEKFIHQSSLDSKSLFEICFNSIAQAGKVKLKERFLKAKQLSTRPKIENMHGNLPPLHEKSKKIWSTKKNIQDSENIARIISSEVKNNKNLFRKKTWLERIISW
jgi:cellulose biosynthesis protein BcsQ